MSLKKLYEKFQGVTELPIEIAEIHAAVVELGVQDEITCLPQKLDTGELAGVFYQYTRHDAAYGSPILCTLIIYPEDEPPDVQRLICAKEFVHVMDAAVEKVKTADELRDLVDTAESTDLFMRDLAMRVANRVQITTDGFGAYPNAVIAEFRGKADFAQVQKIYGDEYPTTPERRYSPAICIGAKKYPVHGNPDPAHISTSHVERSNLTLRMGMKRFARLTNAHSKKVENHGHALALYFAFYNWIRPHASLKGRTPAMAAGLSDVVLTWAEFIKLMDRAEFEIGMKSN